MYILVEAHSDKLAVADTTCYDSLEMAVMARNVLLYRYPALYAARPLSIHKITQVDLAAAEMGVLAVVEVAQ